jgi:xanthine dehydrogenase YagT iron-sulfur-binding subunit
LGGQGGKISPVRRKVDPAARLLTQQSHTLETGMPTQTENGTIEEQKSKGKFTRRSFLGSAGLTAVAAVAESRIVGAATAAAEAAEAEQSSKLHGPDAVSISLNINGETKTLMVEPRTTLLDALRNRLDLTGAKKVCDRGTCGACTVIKDGRTIYSCTALAIDVQGSKIITIESLGTPEKLSPVQAAFVRNDAQQCGFCTPGFVVACTAMLQKNPNPTPEQMRLGLGGNLCRCGTYMGIKGVVADSSAGKLTGGAA